MSTRTVVTMYLRFAGTRIETSIISKHGREIVDGTTKTVSEYWTDLDYEYNSFDIYKAFKL